LAVLPGGTKIRDVRADKCDSGTLKGFPSFFKTLHEFYMKDHPLSPEGTFTCILIFDFLQVMKILIALLSRGLNIDNQ